MTFYETLDQGRAFLLLLYAGMAAVALYDLTALFRAHTRAPAAWLADIAWCALVCALCACALALGGAAGVRLYAVLGLCLGALVYSCGLRAAALWLFHFCAGRKKKRGRRIPSEQESGREES